jgi:hypothetical protein
MGTLTAFPGRNLSSNFRFSGWGAPVAEAEPLLEARNLVKHYLISRRVPLSSWPDALTRQRDDVKVTVDLRD